MTTCKCIDCDHRSVKCHATCEDYKAWVKWHQEHEKHAETDYTDRNKYTFDGKKYASSLKKKLRLGK